MLTRSEVILHLTRSRDIAELTKRANDIADLIESGDMYFDSDLCLHVTAQGLSYILPLLPLASA
jgi:hypothetical protein